VGFGPVLATVSGIQRHHKPFKINILRLTLAKSPICRDRTPQTNENKPLLYRISLEGGRVMYPECRHIMPNGAKCHSPAMRGMAYCYFHTPGRRSAQGQGRAQKKPLKLPVLDDRTAIQIAVTQVLNAIGSSKISRRSAGQLLYGLQIASEVLRRPGRPPLPKNIPGTAAPQSPVR